MSRLDIGLHQARQLCRMSHRERLGFIAEGLPLILESARSLWKGSQQLTDAPRESAILEGHAEEEAAKLLILMDIVRCPPKLTGGLIGPMVRWFYDHLARMIYARAVSWKPVDVNQLREYVDNTRKAHYVDGDMGEYIMPNWELYSREAQLYVDIEAQEDGVRGWSVPRGYATGLPSTEPPALLLGDAFSSLGIFSPEGLRAVAETWKQLDFVDEQAFDDSRRLTQELLERLDRARLFTARATQDHVNTVYNSWQLPMYRLDFSLVPVLLEDLQKEQDNIFFSEVSW